MSCPLPAPESFDEMLRLARFRVEHPEIIIGGGGFGTWQARIPYENGEAVVTRYLLGDLLDKLDAIEDGEPDPPDSG